MMMVLVLEHCTFKALLKCKCHIRMRVHVCAGTVCCALVCPHFAPHAVHVVCECVRMNRLNVVHSHSWEAIHVCAYACTSTKCKLTSILASRCMHEYVR